MRKILWDLERIGVETEGIGSRLKKGKFRFSSKSNQRRKKRTNQNCLKIFSFLIVEKTKFHLFAESKSEEKEKKVENFSSVKEKKTEETFREKSSGVPKISIFSFVSWKSISNRKHFGSGVIDRRHWSEILIEKKSKENFFFSSSWFLRKKFYFVCWLKTKENFTFSSRFSYKNKQNKSFIFFIGILNKIASKILTENKRKKKFSMKWNFSFFYIQNFPKLFLRINNLIYFDKESNLIEVHWIYNSNRLMMILFEM